MKKKLLICVFLAMLSFLLIRCSDSEFDPDEPPKQELTYSFKIYPEETVIIKIGDESQLKLIKSYSNGTQIIVSQGITWVTPNPEIALVSKTGVVTGKGAGKVDIKCYIFADGTSYRRIKSIYVVENPYITPDNPKIKPEQKIQFKLEGIPPTLETPIIWSASPDGIIQIDPATGEATGIAAGSVTVTASVGTLKLQTNCIVVGILCINVLPGSNIIKINTTSQFMCTAKYNDASIEIVQATWSSSDTNVATIDQTGLATGINAGRSTIIATYQGYSAQALLSVVEFSGVTIDPPNYSLNMRESIFFLFNCSLFKQ